MPYPALFFIYKWAAVGDDMHAKCIMCSADTTGIWGPHNRVNGFVLPNGPAVELSQVLSHLMPSTNPIGTEAVYQPEAFFQSAPEAAREALLCMQNFDYVIIRGHRFDHSQPFFVTADQLATPAARKAVVSMCIDGVNGLPDVIQYHAKNERFLHSSHADKWDALMFTPEHKQENIAIPVGAYLPATIESAGREYQAVYQINEYLEPKKAVVTIYLADSSIPFGAGTILRRRRREAGFNECVRDIAVIDALIS